MPNSRYAINSIVVGKSRSLSNAARKVGHGQRTIRGWYDESASPTGMARDRASGPSSRAHFLMPSDPAVIYGGVAYL